jgi:two-component system chemotaxis sensor kinase CheA
LSAYHEGGNIIIELADDGRGLNRDAIIRKAKDRGLISDNAVLADNDVWELIFNPGFSTAEKVTEISGRGVGMDVVKKTVESLRGRIQIATVPGHGTTFRFVLPLTLAIIDGMLMRCAQGRYVLPTLAILESMQPTLDQIHAFASGGMVLDVRGQQLPLVDLSGVLGLPSRARESIPDSLVVIMDGAHGRFGLVVDDAIGQQQVVIKHLDEGINGDALFSGAAILSDGQVGLILNPAALRADKATSPMARRRAAEVG